MRAKANWVGASGWWKAHETLFLISLVILPYASYLGLVGLGVMLMGWFVAYPQDLWHRLSRQGWLWLALGIGVSVAMAENPTMAALQAMNFWPFFPFFAGLSIYITRLPQPLHSLKRWAFWLLVGSIPINLRAILEYGSTGVVLLRNGGGSSVILSHRVDSVFGNPNVLAAYLVIIFGLGLGLCLQTLPPPPTQPMPSPSSLAGSSNFANLLPLPLPISRAAWIYSATALIPVGILCSGSRNGLLALTLQLFIAILLMRRHRGFLWVGLGAITAILGGVLHWGIGGRSIAEAFSSSSLRVDIWAIALPYIQQNPWFGIGFGGFEMNYVPNTIPYHSSLAHVHNLWLHLAAEAGLPVMLLFTGIVGSICYRAVRHYCLATWDQGHRSLLVAYGLGFLACGVGALFDITLFDARVNVLGWMMLAALQAIPDLGESPHPSTITYEAKP